MSSWPVSTVLSTETILEAKDEGEDNGDNHNQIGFATKKKVTWNLLTNQICDQKKLTKNKQKQI